MFLIDFNKHSLGFRSQNRSHEFRVAVSQSLSPFSAPSLDDLLGHRNRRTWSGNQSPPIAS